jgi:hypothetical protein
VGVCECLRSEQSVWLLADPNVYAMCDHLAQCLRASHISLIVQSNTALSVVSPRPLPLLGALFREALSPELGSTATTHNIPLGAIACTAKLLLSGFAGLEFPGAQQPQSKSAATGRAVVPGQIVWQGHLQVSQHRARYACVS